MLSPGVREAAVGMLAVLAVSGCASSPENDTTPMSSPAGEERASPEAEEQALEAYTGLWQAVVEQARAGEVDEAELERYATGQALEFARQSLEERASAGEVARGEPSFSPETARVDQDTDTVEIQDCMDSTAWLREDAQTGDLIEEEPEGPVQRRVEASAEFDGLSWRVSELLLGQVDSC